MFTDAKRVKCCGVLLVTFCLANIVTAQAPEPIDEFVIGIAAQQQWDSNINRHADQEDSEYFTHSSVFLGLNKKLSRHQIIARVKGSSLDYTERTDLDATFYDGNANWRTNWTSRLQTDIGWLRMAYPVDQLEFTGNDIVSRDDVNARITYGSGNRLSVGAGGRQTAQRHSNEMRENMDFDEDEGFVETTYQTGSKSKLILRMRDGQRNYAQPIADDGRLLDFSYRQGELEGNWTASAKTRVMVNLAYFNRQGETNDVSGNQASLEADWAMTEKIQLNAGYSLRQPAIGEASDSPDRVHSTTLGISWQITRKLRWGGDIRHQQQRYPVTDRLGARDEELTSVSPLIIHYQLSDSFTLRLSAQWLDRQSPVLYRDYDFMQGSAGVAWHF
jgi:hypothetical protein